MTVPLSLTGKYQLVVLGAQGDSQVSDCAARLNKARDLSLAHLGFDSKKFLARVMSGASDPDRRMPSVAVFFLVWCLRRCYPRTMHVGSMNYWQTGF
jgi:hypothetical protein